MSSTQSKSLHLTHDNINSYRGSTSGNVSSPYKGTKEQFMHTDSSGTLYLNNSAKNVLFPNGNARPVKCDVTYSLIVSAYNTVTGSLYINGTKVSNDDILKHKANLTNYQSDKTQSGIVLSGATSTKRDSTTIGIEVSSSNGGIVHGTITLYFTRYDFKAVAGENITSTSVSSSTGYDGDVITYNCVLSSGSTFIGWYNNSTLISTDQKYMYTVNGADITLTAVATDPVIKPLSAIYNGSQLQGFPIPVTEAAPISYNGISKGKIPVNNGARIFKCANKVSAGDIMIGTKTLKCANKIMTSDIFISVGINMLNPQNFTLGNVNENNGIYTFPNGGLGMINQVMPVPIAGHQYYGRCYQKAPSDSNYPDGRFEYYRIDGENLIFANMNDVVKDNQWHLCSKILSFSAISSSENWVLRSFTVDGTAESYRKEMMIVDLTELFGAGNEPTKEWCDFNILYQD